MLKHPTLIQPPKQIRLKTPQGRPTWAQVGACLRRGIVLWLGGKAVLYSYRTGTPLDPDKPAKAWPRIQPAQLSPLRAFRPRAKHFPGRPKKIQVGLTPG